ncbi:hypothetical protein F53441_83 [Fusarium austroafricanum]|uniref:Uncharacterized protein n=1 Tax=Fusarium austroafricanum TaxID=2364996 RepID=A0A8H4KXV0_9HYPO|nr:hypothetical protein F53441_83 [Fusarium austroafricanum]
MRAAFLALAALPLYAIAQDIPVDASTTTTSETLAPVIETSSGVSTDADTAIVLPESTSEAILIEPGKTTDTELQIQDTTTQQPLLQETTTGLAPAVDTTLSFDVIQSETTAQGDVPQDTTTVAPVSTSEGNVIIPNTTTEKVPAEKTTQEPVKEKTTEEPVGQGTTTDVPPAETTEQKPAQDTTTGLPAAETTEKQPDLDTTTGAPPAATTTDKAPVQDTTTAAGKPDETATQSGPGDPKPQPTSDEVKDPVITTGPVVPSFTIPLPEVSSSVSSVSSQVDALMPVIDQWKNNQEGLRDETNKEIEDTRNDIVGLIKQLGGDPSVGCGGKKIKARGLLDFITNTISTLACMAEGLGKVAGGVMAGNVPAATGAAAGVQAKNGELDNQKDDKKDDDEKSDEKSEEKSTKQESTKQESSSAKTTEATSTSTEAASTSSEEPTTTTEYFQPCASDTCQGACPMNGGSGKDGKMATMSSGPTDCKDIPTITTDVLPTKPTLIDAPPKKRDLAARAFLDDTTPNPTYVMALSSAMKEPNWVSQVGVATGVWYPFPLSGHYAAGVNGIYGCTAVVIVSTQGVYLSHIWENPVFINNDWSPTSDDSFRKNSFEALRDGTADGGVTAYSLVNLIQLGVLDQSNLPTIFVITPYTTVHDDPIITTPLRYQERAQWLLDSLKDLIPGSQGHLVGYQRTNPSLSTGSNSFYGRAILEVDMAQGVLQGANQQPGESGLSVARWRLWVAQDRVWQQDFVDPLSLFATSRKREDNPNLQCLIVGGSGKTSAGLTTETADITTKETSTEMATEKTTSREATIKRTATTSSAPPTTLKTSFITTAPATDSSTTEDGDTFTGPWPCVNYGGPRVASGYCTCSTTSAGETLFTSAPHISGGCSKYHDYPGSTTPKTSNSAAPAPDPTPFTLTRDNGEILAYTDQAEHLGKYPGGTYTYTLGKGEPSTVRPGNPKQTDAKTDGHAFCGGIDDACDLAARRFKDDVLYTQFSKVFEYVEDGPLLFIPFVDSGCSVEYNCKDWSKGSLLGSQIKEAWRYLRKNTYITKCGTAYLDNGCYIKSDYCSNCRDEGKGILHISG